MKANKPGSAAGNKQGGRGNKSKAIGGDAVGN